MKPTRAVCGVSVVLILFIGNVASTIIGTTLLTGFVGGFLMGKITLGALLTAMNTLNRPQTAATATTATVGAQAKVTTRGSSDAGSFQDIDVPFSLENKVRDRFLRQLGKMDPLNCLPKVFCEISANPKAAETLFGQNALVHNLSILPINQKSPSIKKSKNKQKKKSQKNRPTPSYNDDDDDEPQNDEQEADDEDASDSQSDEDEEPYNEEEAKLKAYEAREAYNIESKALEEMVDEFEDPISYYFLLRDKQKNIHPKLYGFMQNADLSRRNFESTKNEDDVLTKKMGDALTYTVEEDETKDTTSKRSKGSSSMDDIFADDPFFDDFSRSIKFNNPSLAHVKQLRRSRREVDVLDQHDITMAKYRMAAKIAEKYKDPSKCQRVFNSCPFTSEEVMNMITKLNSEDEGIETVKPYTIKKKAANKPKKKDDSLKNLKNTLLAIEKLNDATMLAQRNDQPIDYDKLVQEATKYQVSGASDRIMEDFEQFEDEIEPKEVPIIEVKAKALKTKSTTKRSKKHKRQRRHDGGVRPALVREDMLFARLTNRRSRIHGTAARKDDTTFASMEEEQEKVILKKENVEGRAEKYSDEDITMESSKESIAHLSETVKLTPLVEKELRVVDPKKSGKSDEALEDDEDGSPESEEFFKVPTFSQTFTETGQAPSKPKNRPRPVHPVVKVKPQYLQRTTSTTEAPQTTTTFVRSKRPTIAPLITKNFSGEVEDDEEEANESEKAIDALVSKYKPKDKKTPSVARNLN